MPTRGRVAVGVATGVAVLVGVTVGVNVWVGMGVGVGIFVRVGVPEGQPASLGAGEEHVYGIQRDAAEDQPDHAQKEPDLPAR